MPHLGERKCSTYNSKCSADLLLWLTSPVKGAIEVGLICYSAYSALYKHMSDNYRRTEVKQHTRIRLYSSLSLSASRCICARTLMIFRGRGMVGLSPGVGRIFA